MVASPRQTICYAYCSAKLFKMIEIRDRLVNKEVVYYTPSLYMFFFSSSYFIYFRNTCYTEGNMGLFLSSHRLCTDLTRSLTSETLILISFFAVPIVDV